MDFTTKKELRAQMRRHNRSLAPELRREASSRIFERVETLPQFGQADCIALFASLDDEPGTASVLERWSRDKRIVLPRVEGEVMRFYEYDPAAMHNGAFGIDEPQGTAPCDPSLIDLVIVPGVAFTASGGRMGRGKGYYDRYLSQPGMRAVKVGVCYVHQLVGELPLEVHDVGMDVVCAE